MLLRARWIRRPVVFLVLLSTTAFSQSDPVRSWVSQHQRDVVRQFADLLAIPNVASDTPNIRRNADYISAQLTQRGVTTRLLEEEGGPPIVFGELNTPGARRTIAIYAHYDGQKVDLSQWATPPWQPTLRDAPL